MGAENLLLQKFGRKPTRTHDGKVMTLASNLRFCKDIFHLTSPGFCSRLAGAA
jgi:hypothetical protein